MYIKILLLYKMPKKTDEPKPFKYAGVISAKLYVSPIKSKKYRIVFSEDGEEFKHIDFGAKKYNDFIIYNKEDGKEEAEKHKDAYLARHKDNEDWTTPYTAGSAARWILWNKPTLEASWNDYKRRFNLQ